MYKYTALTEPHSIRVLELQPALRSSISLAIGMLEVSIDKPPNFEALSYAWESQSLDQSISCDGETLLISSTCKAALPRLRRNTQSRLLWIDQICINQTSLREKNHQVAIMGEIYSRARRTIVWLGVNPQSDELLRYAKKLRFLKFWSIFVRPHTVKAKIFLSNSIPWYNRVWTIQEVALAHPVHLLSSKREMDYDQFTYQWMILRLNRSHTVEIDPIMEARVGVRQEVIQRRGLKKWNALSKVQIWDPAGFLSNVTASASTHPSDKIFPIHGIMKDLGIHLLEPDYSIDTGEVYWKACVALMGQTCSLGPLTLVNGIHWNSNIPSWVSDFNQAHRRIVPTLRRFESSYIVVPWNRYNSREPEFRIVRNSYRSRSMAQVDSVFIGSVD